MTIMLPSSARRM